jgi:hypothetical protein
LEGFNFNDEQCTWRANGSTKKWSGYKEPSDDGQDAFRAPLATGGCFGLKAVVVRSAINTHSWLQYA